MAVFNFAGSSKVRERTKGLYGCVYTAMAVIRDRNDEDQKLIKEKNS